MDSSGYHASNRPRLPRASNLQKKWLRNSPDTFRQAPSEEGLASMIADCRPPHVVPESRVWEAFVRVTGGGTSVSLAQLHACARSRPVEAASLQYVSATELGLLEQCRNAFHIAGAGDSPVCEAL